MVGERGIQQLDVRLGLGRPFLSHQYGVFSLRSSFCNEGSCSAAPRQPSKAVINPDVDRMCGIFFFYSTGRTMTSKLLQHVSEFANI